MSKTRGTGLLNGVERCRRRVRAEFNRWHDEEHISRLLQVPSRAFGRSTAIWGGPKYLAMYELEDHNVLRAAAYLGAVKYQPNINRRRSGRRSERAGPD